MQSNKFRLSARKFGFIFTLVFGFMLLSVASASAQWYPQTNRDQRDDRRDRQRERSDDYRRNRDNDNRNNDGYYGNNGNYGGYGNYGYSAARQEGFRDGLAAGRDDARDGERYKPQNHSDYKRGTDGYNSRYGNKGQYKQAYRDAFIQGYNQGYNQGNRNNRNRNGRWGF
jgi:hypothetical protein